MNTNVAAVMDVDCPPIVTVETHYLISSQLVIWPNGRPLFVRTGHQQSSSDWMVYPVNEQKIESPTNFDCRSGSGVPLE